MFGVQQTDSQRTRGDGSDVVQPVKTQGPGSSGSSDDLLYLRGSVLSMMLGDGEVGRQPSVTTAWGITLEGTSTLMEHARVSGGIALVLDSS